MPPSHDRTGGAAAIGAIKTWYGRAFPLRNLAGVVRNSRAEGSFSTRFATATMGYLQHIVGASEYRIASATLSIHNG